MHKPKRPNGNTAVYAGDGNRIRRCAVSPIPGLRRWAATTMAGETSFLEPDVILSLIMDTDEVVVRAVLPAACRLAFDARYREDLDSTLSLRRIGSGPQLERELQEARHSFQNVPCESELRKDEPRKDEPRKDGT